MKIRNPKSIRNVAWVGAQIIRAWIGTVRLREHALGERVNPCVRGFRGRFIYAFWHETLLLPAFHFRKANVRVLISQHADGELIAQVCQHLGLGTVRGSTTRHGAEGLLDMIRSSSESHLVITPDGPRGPRRCVQQGIVYLAGLTGLPIAPIGFSCSRCWRARSWDRFALPRPFSVGYTVTAEPIRVPLKALRQRETVEVYRQRIEDSLGRATEIAERWASTGSVHDLPLPASASLPFRRAQAG